MMRHLGKIARVLGPKGLMPNPKTGTVGVDLLAVVQDIAGGKFEFKTDKHGNVHSIFGKLSFGKEKLEANLEAFLKIIQDVKPTGAKGKYIEGVSVCNAMGPGIKINMNKDEK
jgi:large subunit ribosomal protein L1